MHADPHVVPAPLRRLGAGAALVPIPVCALAFWSVEGVDGFLRALSWTAIVYAVPGAALSFVASTRAPEGDRLVWRLWSAGWILGAATVGASLALGPGDDPQVVTSVGRSLVGLLLLVTANTLMMRRRSGDRAVVVDAIDLAMATLATAVPVALVVGDRLARVDEAWFTLSCAVWWVAGVHGLYVALAMRARIRPDQRTISHIGIVLALVGIASSSACALHGVRDFAAPAGPTIAVSASFMAALTIFFLSSTRHPSAGLERLPAAAQVRRQSVVVVGVLGAVPLLGAVAWVRRDEAWVVPTALVAVCVLLVLSSVRHLLSARETIRLYSEVERAADDRGALLGEVMDHIDADRHRVAAHLHRQAVSLYTSMAALTCALERSHDQAWPDGVTQAAERLRQDLGQRADGLRQVALAVKPLQPGGLDPQGVAAPIRAHVENLWVGGRRPALDVVIDPRLQLDWTTEAIVVRIVQEALDNVHRHARAHLVTVRIGARDDVLRVEVGDDGVGDGAIEERRGIGAMRTMAGFLDGSVEVRSAPGAGTLVVAELGLDPRSEPPRPALTLVRPAP